jgi:hypothetical protein
MVVASLILSILAVLAAMATAVYARTSARAADRSAAAAEDAAVAADRSARASEESLEIEAERRLEERRPRFSGVVERADGRYWLHVTLESNERLELVQLVIREDRGVHFAPNTDGVETPPEAKAAWCAFSHWANEPEGMEPRESMTWEMQVESKHADILSIEATCHGEHDERWESVLIEARVAPDISKTVR